MTRSLALVLALVLAAPARAGDAPPPPDEKHPAMLVFEAAVALAIPAAWYWSTKEHQTVDWELGNDWDSWRTKLFSTEKLLLDTNPFHVNAIRHPLAGVLDYQIVRTNGYAGTTGVMFAAVKSALWEYCFEFREDPSINDMIFNTAGAMSIGEPLYRIGQLWRGGRLTLADRARTALVSPFDAFHDTYRAPRLFVRPSMWASIALSAGGVTRIVDGDARPEVTAAADLDVVANRAFAEGGAYEDTIRFGEWSRLRASAATGSRTDGAPFTRTLFHTATTLFGRYHQDGDGRGELVAMGTAFTYRDDRLGADPDRLALAHLIGPRVQLSTRERDVTVIWDLAGYADFGLAQALVFAGQHAFPPPPPYYSSLQADGYIDAFGVTGATRLRMFAGPFRLDLEGELHLLRQIDGHDRITGKVEAPPQTDAMTTTSGVTEQRGFARAEVAYQPGTWGVALVLDGARRLSTWRAERRTSSELSVGAALTLAY